MARANKKFEKSGKLTQPENVEFKKSPAFAAGPKRVIGSERYGYVRHSYQLRSAATDQSRGRYRLLVNCRPSCPC